MWVPPLLAVDANKRFARLEVFLPPKSVALWPSYPECYGSILVTCGSLMDGGFVDLGIGTADCNE